MGTDTSAMLGARVACGALFSTVSSLQPVAAVRLPAFQYFSSPCSSLWTRDKPKSCVKKPAKEDCGHPLTSCHAGIRSGHHSVDPSQHDLAQVLYLTRRKFCKEVAFSKQDDDVSLAKVALLIAAEDEAFHLLNNEKDVISAQKEGRLPFLSSPPKTAIMGNGGVASLSLVDMLISDWFAKLDHLSHQVEVHLGSDTSEHTTVDILKAMNTVLFKLLGFTRRSHLSTDTRSYYLHLVLNHGCASAVMLGILFIELGKRLGLRIHGGASGESFLIWPAVEGKQMAFEPREGCKTWFLAESDFQTSVSQNSLQLEIQENLLQGARTKPSVQEKLKPASNREILQITLQNLKRLYWRQASRACKGLFLAAPLHPVASLQSGPASVIQGTRELLRPQELRLSLAASERLLVLNPQNWSLRKDHGMLLYHSRQYGEAVQELSICMAFAPAQEMELLQPFVEKLHLLRLEASWAHITSLKHPPAIA